MGKPIPITLKTERRTGAAFGSPFEFKKYGQCGTEISEIFSKVAEHADDLCVIRSMCSDIPNHEPSLMMMNCGEIRQVRPSFGSWITYGLGSENQNLPGFIVLSRWFAHAGYAELAIGILAGRVSGTQIDTRQTQIDKLIENIKNNYSTKQAQRRDLDFCPS